MRRSVATRTLVATCTMIAVAVVAVYAQVAGHDFVEFDDGLYITGNPHIQAGLSVDSLAWAMGGAIEIGGVNAYIWQPLTWLSYLIDAELYGIENAGPWLLTNVGWHIASAWVLLAALFGLTGRFWPSAFVAALFALHPIQTESVAWASGRRDLLAGFFLNLTLLAYAHYVRRRNWMRYGGLLLTMFLSLAAKGSQVSLPFLLLLLDYWPLSRLRLDAAGGESRERLVLEKLPLLFLSLAMVLVNLAPVSSTSGPWATDPPLLERAGDGVMAYGATLGRLFWPDGLAIVYPTPVQMGLQAPSAIQIGVVIAGLIALTVLAAVATQRRGYLIVGWLWFLGMLFPLIGLIPSGLRVMHDRYAYIPMIGIGIAISFGAADLLARHRAPRSLAIALAASVLVACGLVSFNQAGVWQNSLALFDHTLAVTERNAIVRFYRGNTLVVGGDLDGARGEFEAALEINPSYPEALQNLGHLQLRLGRPDLAIGLIERALESRPQWIHATTNLGRAQFANGDRERGLATLNSVVARAPGSVDVRHALAVAYQQSGRLNEAALAYREALRLDPNHEPSRQGLARVRSRQR